MYPPQRVVYLLPSSLFPTLQCGPPPNQRDDKVDSDQHVVNEGLSLSLSLARQDVEGGGEAMSEQDQGGTGSLSGRRGTGGPQQV